MSIFSKATIMHVHQSTVSNQVVWSPGCGTISSSFSVKNGVKQGGVLSPRLFNIYLDELLYKLKQRKIWMLLWKRFCLNGLLTICEQYLIDYNILFNASQTKLMVFGRKLSNVKAMVQFLECQIKWVSHTWGGHDGWKEYGGGRGRGQMLGLD